MDAGLFEILFEELVWILKHLHSFIWRDFSSNHLEILLGEAGTRALD